jgi:hypothetical protein
MTEVVWDIPLLAARERLALYHCRSGLGTDLWPADSGNSSVWKVLDLAKAEVLKELAKLGHSMCPVEVQVLKEQLQITPNLSMSIAIIQY